MNVYSETEINEKLKSFSGWKYESGEIAKTYAAATFNRAIAFAVQIGMLADVADHHPDLIIKYNKVQVNLATHSVNGITDKDFELAGQIEKAFGE